MKHYLFTIKTRDGEHEYYDRWLFPTTGAEPTDLDILVDFTGHPKKDWVEAEDCVYESSYDYRHYSIYSRQEVEPGDLKVLERYGL